METDISFSPATPIQGEEVNFGGLRERPDPYAPSDEDSTPLPQMPPPPPQDYYYYSQPPIMPPLQEPEKPSKPKDILSNMDRTTYILLIIAFVVGFFVGRGMIQPVILRHTP